MPWINSERTCAAHVHLLQVIFLIFNKSNNMQKYADEAERFFLDRQAAGLPTLLPTLYKPKLQSSSEKKKDEDEDEEEEEAAG
jgi:hypothetical protein